MIATIESKIKELNGGDFEKLVCLYLGANKVPVTSFGTKEGTYKTVKGTPDAYIVDDSNNYIFIECTTQQDNIYKKIKEDLRKCIQKRDDVGVKLKKIIYFHTADFRSIAKTAALKEECLGENCIFEIYNVNMLAKELYKYPYILQDELGIAIDKGQIVSTEKFIENYDKRKLSTPLDVNILGREDEVDQVLQSVEENDVTIILGAAGVGKTRIAIEACHKIKENHPEYLVLCIQKNDLNLYDDYKRCFSGENDYLVFVDDANQIKSFKYLLDYIAKNEKGRFKIILSVRDYALDTVMREIGEREFISFHPVKIEALNDEIIKQISEENFGIRNTKYLNRIAEISKGNPRLATMASKIVIDENTLNSIHDATGLIEKYYDGIIEENKIDDSDLLIMACLYLLDGVYFEDVKTMSTVYEITGLTQKELESKTIVLYKSEIIDYCEDVAIKPSDQILSCYLAYCALFKYKTLSLSKFLIIFFKGRKERIVESLNGIFTYYKNANIVECFRVQIEEAWEYFETNEPEILPEYMSAFHTVRPDKTMLHIKTVIEGMDIQQHSGEYVIPKNSQNNIPQELQMLGSYSESEENWQTAIDLVFGYASKQQDQYESIIYVLTGYNGFGIKENSVNLEYREQVYIYQRLISLSNKYEDVFFTNVLLEVSKNYLNIGFEYTESKGRAFTIGEIPLTLCDSSKKLRELVWNTLTIIMINNDYNNKIINIFYAYELRYRYNYGENQTDFAEFDYEYINKIISNINTENFAIIHACADMLKKLVWHDMDVAEPLELCLKNEAFNLYYLLAGDEFNYKQYDYEESKKLRNEKIAVSIADYDTEQYIDMIDTWNDIKFGNENTNNDLWQLSESMEFALLICFRVDSLNHVEIFKHILQMKNNNNLSYGKIMSEVINKYGVDTVEVIINEYAVEERLFFKWIFMHVISDNSLITSDNSSHYIKMLEKYISDEMALNNTNRINFKVIELYNEYDNELLIRVMDKITKDNDNGMAKFSLHRVLEYKGDPYKYITIFKKRLDLLRKLYFSILKADQTADYGNEYLKVYFQEEIITIGEYISYVKLLDCFPYKNSMAERLVCLWELDDHKKHIDEAVNFLKRSNDEYIEKIRNRNILNSIFIFKDEVVTEKQDKWLQKYLIDNIGDRNMLDPILEVIGTLSQERKLMYINTLISHNVTIDIFTAIRFEPRSSGWSGSELPIIDKKIEFLENIEQLLTGVTFIEHRAYTNERIIGMRKYKKSRHIDEFLRDY